MTASEPPVQVAREATSGALTGIRLGRATLSWVRRKPLGAAGAVIVLGMLLVALLAPVIAPYDPVRNAFDRMHVPPSTAHWFGTDQFGRDVLSRLVYGARTAMLVGLVASSIGASLGLMLGVASAYFGGRFDLFFQRLMDIFMAFPADHHGARHRVNLWHRHPQCRRGDHCALYSTLCSGGTFQRSRRA